MPSILGKKQEIFYRLNNEFDHWILSRPGHEIRGGELWRHPAVAELNSVTCRICKLRKEFHTERVEKGDHKFQAIGIKNSLHTLKLAIDKNLFIHGIWQRKTRDFWDLGQKWKSMAGTYRGIKIVTCWGGDFRRRPDGNHFSIMHNGVK